jgi:GMP synthase (glutamine-hydrolysing)
VRVLEIVHQEDAGSGVFGDVVRGRGHELDGWAAPDEPAPSLAGYDAVLVFGGGMHVDQEDSHPWLRPEKALLRDALDRGVPLLGICLGSQLVAEAAGAKPHRASRPEIGWHEVELLPGARDDELLRGLPRRFTGFGWHSYEFPLPPRATALARSAACLQAYRLEDNAWGLQFHAEVTAESVDAWLRKYREDEDAVRARLDPDALREETARRIGAWNELGRTLCRRFLDRVGP